MTSPCPDDTPAGAAAPRWIAGSPEPAEQRQAAARPPPRVRVRMLGGFEVAVGAAIVDPGHWRRRKVAHLVKLLALAPGHWLRRDELLELLWPRFSASDAANNLRVTLHAARRILASAEPAAAGLLRFESDRLVFAEGQSLCTDVEAFEAAAAAARGSGDVRLYAAALAAYGGDLLPEDLYEEWAVRRREALRELHLSLVIESARAYARSGEPEPAIEAFQRAIDLDPTREEAYAGLMRLYAVTGRRQQALRCYQRLREVLRREIDVEPDSATTRLHEEILAQRLTGGSRAPAARSDPPSRTNLPSELTSFIGRERDTAALTELTRAHRLVTLTGPGGIGKTRLALQVARRLLPDFPHGVWLVELASLQQPSLLTQAVATALGIRDGWSRPSLDTLVDALRDKRMLLVIDNCEHLVSACAELIHGLLASCPELRVLATSRESLRVPGEARWAVPPLMGPAAGAPAPLDELARVEAVRLFIDRVRLKRPDFALREPDTGHVARLCRRLEGLPLAIELAAAYAHTLSIDQIVQRLDDGLDLLTADPRAAAPRHQTLRATLDWSHRLLEPLEQAVFRRLAVFAGEFTLPAAETVGAGSDVARGSVVHLLSRLADKSLLMTQPQHGEVRYRLLEPVRQYARERLIEAGELDLSYRRLGEWCLTLTGQAGPELWGERQTLWLARLDAEHDNLRAALEWSLAHDHEAGLRLAGNLWWYWRVRGLFAEGRYWLESMLRREGGDPAARAGALLGAGILAMFQGDRATARPLLDESLALNRETRNQRGTGWALANLGLLALADQDVARAQPLLEESLAILQAAGDQAGQAWVLDVLGDLARAADDLPRAADLYRQALAIRRRVGDRRGAGWALLKLGNVARIQERYEEARRLFTESATIYEAVGDRWDAGWMLGYQGILALAVGDARAAESLLTRALIEFRQTDDRLGSAYCLFYVGVLRSHQGDPAGAARLLAAAEAHRRSLGIWLTSAEDATIAAALSAARAALPDELFARLRAEGEAMTLEQAVSRALYGRGP